MVRRLLSDVLKGVLGNQFCPIKGKIWDLNGETDKGHGQRKVGQ
jgi:hypothetical protein